MFCNGQRGKRRKKGRHLCLLTTALKLDSLFQNLQFEELCMFSPAKQGLAQNMIIPGIFIEEIHWGRRRANEEQIAQEQMGINEPQ